MFFSKSEEVRKSDIDKKMEAYERRRKLEIDEQLSEYRRKSKNDALMDVQKAQEESIKRVSAITKEASQLETSHVEHKASKEAEIAKLDAAIACTKRASEQAEADYESRSLLRERTSKAERAAFDKEIAGKDAVIAEQAKTIATLEAQIKTHTGLSEKAIVALGEAASKDHSTKVVGFGQAVSKD